MIPHVICLFLSVSYLLLIYKFPKIKILKTEVLNLTIHPVTEKSLKNFKLLYEPLRSCNSFWGIGYKHKLSFESQKYLQC